MKFQTPRGTRDFLPDYTKKRRLVFDTFRNIYEKYGYGEIETPAFENMDLFIKKGSIGDEAIKDVYRFKDKSGRELALRFDLTTPIARIVASKKDIAKPIKWFYNTRMWRYEDVSKGRWREFYQSGLELIGPSISEADTEILQIVIECMIALGFEDFTVRINSRKVLDEIANKLKIKNKDEVFRILDKLDKRGKNFVKKELSKLMKKEQAEELLSMITGNKIRSEEMKNIIKNIDSRYRKYIKVDYSIARGLDYYTGFIFETIVRDYEDYGSVCSGGRYDNLIEKYGGSSTKAVGFSAGADRIIEIMEKAGMFPESTEKTYFVVSVSEAVKKEAVKIAQRLRKNNLCVETDLMNRSVTKQLDYINRKGIDFAVIIGPKELSSGRVKIKDMKTGEEKEVDINKIESSI